MAHITEFTVEGLAGRTEPYSQQLQRHVNVFFGANGSGKTSLLKILNAAMSNEVNSLRNVPFTRAEVKIYSLMYKNTYTYSYEKPKVENAAGDEASEAFFSNVVWYANPRFADVKGASWTVEPQDQPHRKVGTFFHSYLPISRLYMSPQAFRLAEQPGGITEEQFEDLFDSLIKQLWSAYSAEVLGTVQRAQAKGLADILKALLTGKSSSDLGVEGINPRDAYERVSNFMERQGSKSALGDAQTFQKSYESNPQLRSVVADINSVELQIQEATAPRNKLQSLIEQMFSGNKKVTFTDSAIDIRGNGDEPIGLARLSSGEKQLIRILVDTLVVAQSSLILDEPEISMHVDWQHQLIRAMRQLNPQFQLVAATHSPEIMAEIPDENIFRL